MVNGLHRRERRGISEYLRRIPGTENISAYLQGDPDKPQNVLDSPQSVVTICEDEGSPRDTWERNSEARVFKKTLGGSAELKILEATQH